jgi:aarF domain-containing kinase
LKFPKAIYSTPNVLFETFEKGESISQLVDQEEEVRGVGGDSMLTKRKRSVARTGLEAILSMIFKDNFIHGDLHPG